MEAPGRWTLCTKDRGVGRPQSRRSDQARTSPAGHISCAQALVAPVPNSSAEAFPSFCLSLLGRGSHLSTSWFSFNHIPLLTEPVTRLPMNPCPDKEPRKKMVLGRVLLSGWQCWRDAGH